MFRVGAEAEQRVLTELQYRFPEQVHSDLNEVRSVFSDLRLYSDFYCFPNKQKRRLLFLAGTIPVSFQGFLYNYPVCIWLHQTHPASRPQCFVVPSVSMMINTHCHHVDAHGIVHLTCLQNWIQGESSLTLLVSEMKEAFEEDTPLYSRPLPLHQTTPPQPQVPSPAAGGSPSGSLKVLVQNLKRSYCEDLKGIDFSSSCPTNRPIHLDQTLSDRTLLDWTHSDRALSDRTHSDRMNSDQSFSDWTLSDQTLSDRSLSDRTHSYWALSDWTHSNRTLSDRTHSDWTLSDWTLSDLTHVNLSPFRSPAHSTHTGTSCSESTECQALLCNQSDEDRPVSNHSTEMGGSALIHGGRRKGERSQYENILRAITALRLYPSPERSGQSEHRDHTGQSEHRDHSGQSEQRDHSGQSERRDHSGQSERRAHTGQSEQNPKPRLRPGSEEELLKLASGLPRHKVQVFPQLLQSEGKSHSTSEILEATHLNPDLTSARRYLQHLCPICQDRVSFSKMVTMTHCSCFLCESCFRSWFSAVIREKSVEQLVCPLCGRPELKTHQDLDQDYFSLLDTQIRHFLSEELHELFQRKLRDRALTEMKHFCWCSHCSFGLVHESGSLRMDCPSCNKSTCSRCRAPWSPQHQGVSCEDFRLQTRTGSWTGPLSNCIECPDCGESYSGSRGGCLHFVCPRCGTEFCGGCNQRFVHGQSCSFSESCWSRGLHAHHPRDCVYHLRDWSVARLHLLLQFYRVSPSWIEPANQSAEPNRASGVCPVLELRDSSEAPCGRAVPPGFYRGYCRAHYVERVVQLLNSFGGDPLVLFSVEELETELRRWNQTVPTRGPSEPEQQYRERLTAVVLQTVPLKNHSTKPSLWTHVSAPCPSLPSQQP